jgi:hypothetical protein
MTVVQLMGILKVLFMLLLLVPVLPACFFFINPWGGRYPRNKREWIIAAASLAYVPVYFAIIHHWPDLKL